LGGIIKMCDIIKWISGSIKEILESSMANEIFYKKGVRNEEDLFNKQFSGNFI
jgi:hypothetical protein